MVRRTLCKALLAVVVAVFGILALSGVLFAQGRSADAFERVAEVQERHTEVLMAMPGVVGTAIGLGQGAQPVMLVLVEHGGVRNIPQGLEGVPVRPLVTGKIYALAPPPKLPKPPRGLTATAVSESQINLDWRDNREADLSHYNVYCSTSSGGPYSYVDSADISSYPDTGLTADTTYYYVVTAVTSVGESNDSSEASATTEGGAVEPPAAPSDLVATPAGSSQIDLSWTDTSDNETGFEIERDFVPIATVGANVTSYSDTGLQASTTYTYQVRAYNGAGDSGYSNSASATTEAASEKPPHWCERPVPIGVSTGHPDITAGTIGCRVKAGTTLFALSNNHVYANENLASFGDPVLQPGPYDDGTLADDIGTLYDFEPIVFHPRANNTIDAAIATIILDDGVPRVGNATPVGDPDYADGYGTPSSTIFEGELLNLAVQKYGRTTGLENGAVYAVNATVRVGYDSGTARFVEQIIITPGSFSAGGDSGSLVVANLPDDPDDKKAVGLLFAGSSTMTVANPIDLVLARFGVTIDGE